MISVSKVMGVWSRYDDNVEGWANVERNDQLRFYCLGTLSCNLIFNLFARHDTKTILNIFRFCGIGKLTAKVTIERGDSLRYVEELVKMFSLVIRSWLSSHVREALKNLLTLCFGEIGIRCTMITSKTKGFFLSISSDLHAKPIVSNSISSFPCLLH